MDVNAAIVVFDTIAKDTFEEAKRWISDVKDNKAYDFVLAIVRSKFDLEY